MGRGRTSSTAGRPRGSSHTHKGSGKSQNDSEKPKLLIEIAHTARPSVCFFVVATPTLFVLAHNKGQCNDDGPYIGVPIDEIMGWDPSHHQQEHEKPI